MITPSFSITATERVLPKLALDFTTASLDSRVTFTRTTDATHPATYINSSGYVTSATNNQPRFDYNLNTGGSCNGLLIEESRTNYQTNSQNFSTGWGVLGSASVLANQGTSVNGVNDAYKLSFAASAVSSIYSIGITGVGTGTYTVSIYAKQSTTGKKFRLRVDTVSPTFVSDDFTTTSTWQRFTYTFTSATFAPTTVYVINEAGAVAGDILIQDIQFEAGSFATSYIPTTAASLTRNADVATMTGTNFTSWFNTTEGTFEVQAIAKVASASIVASALISAWSSNTVFITMGQSVGGSASTQCEFYVRNTSDQFYKISGASTITANTSFKAVLGYKASNYGAALNGAAPQTAASGNVPTVAQLNIGSNGFNSTVGNVWISKLNFYNQKLITNELQAFSK